ncbi:MAG: prephenate dehydratase [Actinobacteria bacterium HGW-Actinobacteria-7]|nr:MAG: prephenate dehydratase [Actinobacteria bacterium HGW-Actinobacteria-7]
MVRYAFLGPAGTFSEEALLSLGVEGLEPISCTTIDEVFEAVERGRAEAGIVPIENSVEGSVPATLDALAFDTQLEIQSELVLDIHHCLVASPGTATAEVKEVYAHPQASGQCRRWIARSLPGRTVIAANSNAEAVQSALARPGTAALGPALAADLYGAEILERNVEDYAGNQTRFVVIGRGLRERTGSDKTSLALFLKTDKAGALLMILSEFAYAEINLTKIQSRPTKRQLGDYMFFMDFEGHVDDQHVRTALDCLRLKLREVKVLGSYPRA